MLIDITVDPIEPEKFTRSVMNDNCGAVVTFLGTARGHSDGKEVLAIEFEAFPDMARKKLEEIAADVKTRWPVTGDVAVCHRTGSVKAGEIIVVVAVSAPHRKEAFEACEYTIERLKQIAPIWKKEVFADGQRWVGK